MKIGVVLEHYSGRNDIRELVARLAERHQLVLFGARDVIGQVRGSIETRAFEQRYTWSHALWLQLFNFAGAVPGSRDNFLVTEAFKIANVVGWRRRFAMVRLWIRLTLPTLISFDTLLDRLVGSDRTPLDDIERLLVITELSSPSFLAHALAEGRPVDAYVYSWDHACKHTRVSKRIRNWYVWHDGIRDDLVELQGIDPGRIRVIGATQLAYVWEYLEDPSNRVPRRDGRYVYYGCGAGDPTMAGQEVRLIEYLAEALQRVDPELTLLVRPYPFLTEMRGLRDLSRRPNVELDIGYRKDRNDNSLRKEDIFYRLNLQDNAAAFVHCGTTMGMEGAYLRAPILFLDLQEFDYGVPQKQFLHLRRFIHQYHNERYMILDSQPNVVRRTEHLESMLREVLAKPAGFLRYNEAIAARMPLRPLAEIAEGVVV